MKDLRREVEELKQLVSELQEELRILQDDLNPPDNPFNGKFGIKGQQAAVLQCIYRYGTVTYERLDAVTSRYQHLYASRLCDKDHLTKRTNVVICKLRKLLAPFGVTIECVRFTGYKINAEDRLKLKHIFNVQESAD